MSKSIVVTWAILHQPLIQLIGLMKLAPVLHDNYKSTCMHEWLYYSNVSSFIQKLANYG